MAAGVEGLATSESPDDSRRSTKSLVRFRGGELTVQEYLRWVGALPPQLTAQLRQANDSMLGEFARVLTQNVLLLRTADSAGQIFFTERGSGRVRLLRPSGGVDTITTLTPQRVKGTFTATLRPQPGKAATAPLTITNGTFDVGIE